MLNNRFIAAFVLVCFGLVVYFIIPSQIVDDGFGGGEGAAKLPKVATGLIILLGLADLIAKLIEGRKAVSQLEVTVEFGASQLLAILSSCCIFWVFNLILFPLGYLLAGALLVLILMVTLGQRFNIRAIVVSCVVSGLLFAIMQFGFGSNLPTLPQIL